MALEDRYPWEYSPVAIAYRHFNGGGDDGGLKQSAPGQVPSMGDDQYDWSGYRAKHFAGHGCNTCGNATISSGEDCTACGLGRGV